MLGRALLTASLGALAGATCTTGQVAVPVIEPARNEPPPVAAEPEASGGVARYVVRLGSAWFGARAAWLGISVRAAELRDAEMSGTLPPDGFWDRQTAIEAAALWGALCNDCHGGRRRVSRAKQIPPPAPDWGTKQGFFFGRPRLPSQVFETILSGGPPRGALPSEMPPWRRRLSREQIWALVYFIAFESGGVEGAFPPSLFPQRTEEALGPAAPLQP
ncbi:cytochrome c [Myxococcota bacterium]|nr:cytochrome c [Myxococcota bacterium]